MDKKYSFNVDEISRMDGKRYHGTFHMRRPNIGDLGAISAAMSRLNQGQPIVSEQFEMLLTVVATMEICGEDIPKWWKHITDESADTILILRIGNLNAEARSEGMPFRAEKDKSPQADDEREMGAGAEDNGQTSDT